MKNEDLLKQTINLILNYHGRSIIVELKKYKTLTDVKQKVFDLFFPVQHNINLYLNNKNLEPLINQPIGYIFSGQSLVKLKVVDEGVNDSPFKLVNRYQDSFYVINDLMKSYNRQNLKVPKKANKINSISNDNNKLNKSKKNINDKNKSLMLNKNKLYLLKTELNNINDFTNIYSEVKNKKLFNSSSVDNLKTKKIETGRLKLPVIHPKNAIVKNVKNSKNKISNNQNNNIIIYNKCNDCYINKIFIYCRQCDKFICNNCALNKKGYHLIHKVEFIKLAQDSNKANIKLYKNLIITNLKGSLFSFNNIGKKAITSNNEEEKKENKSNDENENTENNKSENYDYNQMINNISDNIYKLIDKVTEMKNTLKEIDFSQMNDDENNKKIYALCENEKNVLKNFNVYEYVSPFQPFKILNNYERNMAKYFNTHGANNDERIYIKTQIEIVFEDVEKEVDNALAEIDKIIGEKDILK
jgi:hypothetical protein